MKLTKALYFIAFLLAINVFAPGSNNYVEAKPAKGNGNSLVNKIKNNKVAFISTLIATLALAAAGTTFGVMHLKKKKGSKNKTAGGNDDTSSDNGYYKRQTIFDYDPKMYSKIY
ncbi:early transcribed membrane protein [Plasmodium chabaudi chabaudi]|uniref:Early transcribed membrane protein n=1 Tax=Plasmodium chabaudi chabaudi TaxID=31271 RepID=A0A4V0KDW8_PLACU|nr:early transcribed membrane protein [Plasmodium chabaudi chabaudi]VTZ71362.1 early transcribed membrane protein [Plasmodium chabaudi chabaudi]|eukprot:XP_016655117.1 early transcribed membrane protein [Plasmodium chabaudi chabaudi]